MSQQFAVMGNPIEHSRSPELHHQFAKAAGIDLNYRKKLVALDEFSASVQEFFAHEGRGLNITVPFKEQAFGLCEVLTERARAAGAVNTLWQQNGQLHGDNTDGQGLVMALESLGWSLAQARILILGAGGATRGVILPLAQAGAGQIVIANRTVARAQQLLSDIQPFVSSIELQAIGLDALAGEYDLVINATSASLSGEVLTLPAELVFQQAYEMAYGKQSSFLKQAKARGAAYSDGFSMLVGQAIEAFYIWHGVRLNLRDFL